MGMSWCVQTTIALKTSDAPGDRDPEFANSKKGGVFLVLSTVLKLICKPQFGLNFGAITTVATAGITLSAM